MTVGGIPGATPLEMYGKVPPAIELKSIVPASRILVVAILSSSLVYIVTRNGNEIGDENELQIISALSMNNIPE